MVSKDTIKLFKFLPQSLMSYEAGSRECRNLIDAKENIIKVMQSLNELKNLEHIELQLKEIYNELENLHEIRRSQEN